jgi:hypothetical protein
MPTTVTAQVTWDSANNRGTVADITVPKSNDGTMITWSCGAGVQSFTITGLDATEFSPAQSPADTCCFTTFDSDQQAGDYSYTVEATPAGGGPRSRHDPKIINTP